LAITDVEWQAQQKIISGGKYDGFAFDFETGDAVWLEISFSEANSIFSSRTGRVTTKGPGVGTSEQLSAGFVIGSGVSAFACVLY